MADIALVTAGRVHLVEAIGHGQQRSLISGELIVAGAPVYIDPTTGRVFNSDANVAGKNVVYGIASIGVGSAGLAVTVIKVGTLDGYNLDAVPFGASIFVSDTAGRLADAAGTLSLPVGRVVPGLAVPIGTTPDKLLEVNIL